MTATRFYVFTRADWDSVRNALPELAPAELALEIVEIGELVFYNHVEISSPVSSRHKATRVPSRAPEVELSRIPIEICWQSRLSRNAREAQSSKLPARVVRGTLTAPMRASSGARPPASRTLMTQPSGTRRVCTGFFVHFAPAE
jgi:hypothetical protein